MIRIRRKKKSKITKINDNNNNNTTDNNNKLAYTTIHLINCGNKSHNDNDGESIPECLQTCLW